MPRSAPSDPPVGDDGNLLRHNPATFERARGEASPAQMVLEFVKVVLAVFAVATEPPLQSSHRS